MSALEKKGTRVVQQKQKKNTASKSEKPGETIGGETSAKSKNNENEKWM